MGSGTKWLRPLVSHLKRPLRVCSGETEGGWGLAQGSWVGGGVETCGPVPPLSHTPEFVFSVISSSHDPRSNCLIMLWDVFRVCIYVCTREREQERER